MNGRHVAAAVIGEDREPSPAEARHLDTCPECLAAVRRRRPFDAQLAAAAQDLVTTALPREVLSVNDVPSRDRQWWSPGGVVVGAALVAVIGFGAYLGLSQPSASSNAGASLATPVPQDSHVVQVGDVTYRFGLRKTVFEITRTVGGKIETLTMTDFGQFATGSAMYPMVCPDSVDRSWIRFVFGHLDGSATYDGPAADGHSANDGTFLFVLHRDAKWTGRLEIKAVGGAVGAANDPFEELEQGRGPAGCRVSE
jgi:hypothetical protein